jgi:nucleotide-binding universal stress UspA family protein
MTLRILCPLDQGENATAVARVAASVARRLEARLLLAHVIEPIAITPADRGPQQVLAANAREFLERTAGEAGCAEWAQAAVRIGDPASALEHLAGRWRADLVICGSHGRRSFRSALLGSVSRCLIKRSGRAVIVVPPQAAKRWQDGEPADGTMRSIVCGVDGSMVGFEAAEAAGHIAAKIGARLTLVHAYLPVAPIGFTTPPHKVLDVGTLTESERSSRTRLLSRAATLASDQTDVTTVIREDEAVPALEKVAEEQRAGLIAVGSRGRGQLLSTVLGSTSARLAVSASRPVLVIHTVEGARLQRLGSTREPGLRVSERR